MSETPQEAAETYVSEHAARDKEYILSNGAELYDFLFSNPDIIEELANLMVMHWTDKKLGNILKQQINTDLDRECGDKAREAYYDCFQRK